MPMEDVGRAFERSETDGFIKIIVNAGTRRLLGEALLGIGGDEIVQGLLDLMYAKAPWPGDPAAPLARALATDEHRRATNAFVM